MTDGDGLADPVHERLRTALTTAGVAAAWEWHAVGKRVIGDAGFATLFSVSVEEAKSGIPAARFFAMIHPEDRDRMRLAIGAMLRGAEVLSRQFRVHSAEGAIRWLQVRGRTADGPPGSGTPEFSGILLDITEQKRLEEQLRIAQTAGGIGTFEHIDGYGTASVSAQFCALLGLHSTSDLPVRTINGVVCPGDPPVIDTSVPGEPGSVSRADFRIVRPDTKELRWLTRRGEYLRDAETLGVRLSGVIYDITEAKRVEAQLRELNDTLEGQVADRTRERDRIWRVSQDLLGVADPEGRWLSINPAWTTLLGWSTQQIVGRSSAWLEHPDDQPAAIRQPDRIDRYQLRLRHQDGGYRWLSWTAVPEDGLLYCVGRDITAEKDAQAALFLTEEQLRQSQKMEAVGQLTGGLAHDFNNLLTGISGSLQLLHTRLQQGRLQDLERYIVAAQGASKRAAAITHRLLAFSRRQTLAPKPTDINRLVAGLDDLIRRTMGPEVRVEVVSAGGLWSTLVDPNQLENALLNLCINARDAMPGGGHLVIEPGNRWLDHHAAAERDLPPGQYVTLCVSDNGAGMPPEVASRACDPFFTTKPLGQGTGLGLSMIYGFARQSGGQVRIYSEVGQGTMVCIYLPRHGAAIADTPVPDSPVAPLPRAEPGQTVLVVDDEPTIRMLVAEVLQELGYVAIEAADGAAALAVLRSTTRIDLLVTDVGLPGGLNGRQVADGARACRPDLKVLFITGYAENALLSHGHLGPGMHVVTKPFAIDALAKRIKALLADA